MTTKPLDDRLASILEPGIVPDPPRDVVELPPPLDPGERNLQIEDGVEVAGLGSFAAGLGQKVGKKIEQASKKMGGEFLEPATELGAKAARDPVIVGDKAPVAAVVSNDAAKVTQDVVKPAPQAPVPVDAQRMMELDQRRQELAKNGENVIAASPTPAQEAAGVKKGPISTVAFDNASMRSMIAAASEQAVKEEPSMSVRSIYMRAVNAGVPEEQAERILSGIPMESNVGGYELAKNVAGLVKLHDDSAAQLDGLMGRMVSNDLNDVEKLQLRQQIAFHDSIVKSLKGVQVDVARTMNTFKRVRDTGPGLKDTDLRRLLDDMGSDASLMRFAIDYMDLPDRTKKNKLLEVGWGKKLMQSWMYSYQGLLLTNTDTHAAGLASNILFGLGGPVERTFAVPIGMARRGIVRAMGKEPAERYYMGEVIARVSGIQNGILDGLELAAHVAKTGQRATAKGDQQLDPIRGSYFADTPIRTGNVIGFGMDVASVTATTMTTGLPLPVSPLLGGLMDFGKEVGRIPDISNSWIGRGLDRLGAIYSIPYRALGVVDEGIGGMSARMQLHEEMWNVGNKEFDRLVAAGLSPEDATKEVQRINKTMLTERPASIAASVDQFRKQSTLMDEFDRSTKLGEFYWKLDHVLQIPAIKVHVPFARAISQIFIEGAARLPIANFVSPRFWDEWNKGGKYRDLATSRLALGGITAGSFAYLALQNRVTGNGPEQREDKAALEAMGYQDKSLIFEPGELSERSVSQLRNLTKVSVGNKSFEGKVFVSFARFEPISLPVTVGADIGDYMKFYRGRPDDMEVLKYVLAGADSSGEYVTTLPAMQGVGEIVSIARSRQEDGGEKVVQVFDRLGRQYADFLFTGIPGVGAMNSSMSAKLERLADPTIRSSMATEQDVPYGARMFYEQRSRLMGRTPFLSKNVEPERDNLGREVKVKNRGLDHWANWIPGVSVTVGKYSKTDEALVSLDYGVGTPSKTWDGVSLSARQYNRYKELYGQKIKIEGSDGVMRNLEQAIPVELAQMAVDSRASQETFNKGAAQKAVDALVSKYRQVAKVRMLGFDNSPQPGQQMQPSGDVLEALYANFPEMESSPRPEFPELGAAIQKNKKFTDLYGK
jgi:hypothetical protein